MYLLMEKVKHASILGDAHKWISRDGNSIYSTIPKLKAETVYIHTGLTDTDPTTKHCVHDDERLSYSVDELILMAWFPVIDRNMYQYIGNTEDCPTIHPYDPVTGDYIENESKTSWDRLDIIPHNLKVISHTDIYISYNGMYVYRFNANTSMWEEQDQFIDDDKNIFIRLEKDYYCYVAKLVAAAWLGEPENVADKWVEFKDKNKLNLDNNNLEWGRFSLKRIDFATAQSLP